MRGRAYEADTRANWRCSSRGRRWHVDLELTSCLKLKSKNGQKIPITDSENSHTLMCEYPDTPDMKDASNVGRKVACGPILD